MDTVGAQQFGAVETLGRCLSVLPVDQLTEIAERILGLLLAADDLNQAGHEEVVRQLPDPADRKLGPFPAERAREFPVVAVFLVGRFGVDVAIDALFAEGVPTVKALGVLVALEANLADEEFVVDLLGKLGTRTGNGSGPRPGAVSRGGDLVGTRRTTYRRLKHMGCHN